MNDFDVFFDYLYSLFGVTVKAGQENEDLKRKVALTKIIQANYSNYGLGEIENAFGLVASGQLFTYNRAGEPEKIEIKQRIDGVTFSNVMFAYNTRFNRADIIRQYKPKLKPKEMSKEQHDQKNKEAYTEIFNKFVIPSFEKFKDSDVLEYEPYYNDYREWMACDALLFFNMLDLDAGIKKEAWDKSEKIALDQEKIRIAEMHMKGNITEKLVPQDVDAKRRKVYRHLCFWEQLVSWKKEGKELQTIEN